MDCIKLTLLFYHCTFLSNFKILTNSGKAKGTGAVQPVLNQLRFPRSVHYKPSHAISDVWSEVDKRTELVEAVMASPSSHLRFRRSIACGTSPESSWPQVSPRGNLLVPGGPVLDLNLDPDSVAFLHPLMLYLSFWAPDSQKDTGFGAMDSALDLTLTCCMLASSGAVVEGPRCFTKGFSNFLEIFQKFSASKKQLLLPGLQFVRSCVQRSCVHATHQRKDH